jgi:aryl-alcohol dehydrogenase-like predicted oxidoreductase
VKRLGRSIRRIGFGGRGLDRDRVRVLSAAIDDGVDVVDVSPAWADAEALAGEAIRELRARDRVLLATRAPADRTMQASIEASLRATRLDVIPLVLFPAWSTHPQFLEMVDRLVREGKALAWGLAPDDPRDLPLEDPRITTVLAPFHIQDRRLAALLPAAAEHGVAVLACRTMDGGLFDPDTGISFALREPAVSCAVIGTSDLAHLRHDLALGA